jgi:hypothetical protein
MAAALDTAPEDAGSVFVTPVGVLPPPVVVARVVVDMVVLLVVGLAPPPPGRMVRLGLNLYQWF